MASHDGHGLVAASLIQRIGGPARVAFCAGLVALAEEAHTFCDAMMRMPSNEESLPHLIKRTSELTQA